MAELLAKLEAEYCPPLDPSLLSAILYDYDLSDESAIQQARATLDALKETALEEEQTGFDASGTGAQNGVFDNEEQGQSRPETSDVLSRETDLTSLSNGVSSLDLESRLKNGSPSDQSISSSDPMEAMDEDTKVDILLEVIAGSFTRTHALHTLRKCKGNWHRAMEEMLTHTYLDEAQHSDDGSKIFAKGIDAFSEDNLVKRGRKGKSRKKKLQRVDERRSSSLPVSPADSYPPPTNKWQKSSEDIEFVATRTNMSNTTVASIYSASGASLPRTIGAILKKSIQDDPPTDDPIIAVNAYDLKLEFPTIAPDYVTALVRLTHPSTAAAHELSKALTARPPSAGGIQIIPKYTAPNLENDGNPWETVSKPRRSSRGINSSLDSPDAAAQASTYAAARRAALAQAHAAHRKAKSDRLMGGAAAYYGERSRELAALSSRAAEAAADNLATTQSSAYQVDLHGIDVLNGVRIARENVELWWDRLGEDRVNGRLGAMERQAGYTIVVGRGTHSQGGKGKLGPAISKMLKSEGWKYELDGAFIVVKGRVRV